MKKLFDVVIVGSGFSGSLLGIILNKCGLEVAVIESGSHPRFAIGESSTPIADMILRSLASDYDLPWLAPFSRYGSWQASTPEITCGLKRGFSYFFHKPGEPFRDTADHENALLVAASISDEQSDTHWLRAEFDAFLAGKLRESGVFFQDNTRIENCRRKDGPKWEILIHSPEGSNKMHSDFIIDATGSAQFAAEQFGAEIITNGFETCSGAVFSHFEQAGLWMEYLKKNDIPLSDYPYHPDNSALHHIIEEGWVWMLRFKDNRLSAGIVLEHSDNDEISVDAFRLVVDRYPSLEKIFRNVRLAAMPGKMMKADRLQRRLGKSFGDGWLALGNTIGFIDPLHSTGIAHTLSHLEKVAGIVKKRGLEGLHKFSKDAADGFNRELGLIDHLVAGCYHSRFNPELFHAATMLYFVCSVTYEQNRLRGETPENYLCANDDELVSMVQRTYLDIKRWKFNGCDEKEAGGLVKEIAGSVKPWNTVGLMDKKNNRMYHHTAAVL